MDYLKEENKARAKILEYEEDIYRINKGCTILFLLLFTLTIGLITYEVSNARLVYLDLSKDGKLTMSSVQGARGTAITLRRIRVSNLYDVKTKSRIEKASFLYNWAPIIGLQRRFFLDKERIKNSDKIYFYLYEGEFFLPDACFGLMADKKPSKAYFYTDIVRFSISYFFLLFAFSAILFEWIEKKYLDKKLSINQWIGRFLLFWFILFIVY